MARSASFHDRDLPRRRVRRDDLLPLQRVHHPGVARAARIDAAVLDRSWLPPAARVPRRARCGARVAPGPPLPARAWPDAAPDRGIGRERDDGAAPARAAAHPRPVVDARIRARVLRSRVGALRRRPAQAIGGGVAGAARRRADRRQLAGAARAHLSDRIVACGGARHHRGRRARRGLAREVDRAVGCWRVR